MHTLCLAMMVRDEEQIIRRALESAKPHIQAWCIADTGSTDKTKAIIRRVLKKDIPGQLLSMPWQNFGANRTAVVREAAKQGTDYILMMDADQELVVQDAEFVATLTQDAYNIEIRHGSMSYPHPWLLRANRPWLWRGATHEYLDCKEPFTCGSTDGLYLVEHADSHRRLSGAKVAEDKALLLATYQEDPSDPRTIFYLAQCCQDEGNLSCAIRYYRERVALGGWIEEAWCAQYRIGLCYEQSGTWPAALDAYLEAWRMAPLRAEPVYHLGRGCLMRKQFSAALVFFRAAACLVKPVGGLFVEDRIYDYAAWWGAAMAQRLLGEHEHAESLEDQLINSGRLPASVQEEIYAQRSTKSIGRLPS